MSELGRRPRMDLRYLPFVALGFFGNPLLWVALHHLLSHGR